MIETQEDVNNMLALMSVFMKNSLESATIYTIHSGRKIATSKDISIALKREMFIFMERENIEEEANKVLDEIEDELIEQEENEEYYENEEYNENEEYYENEEHYENDTVLDNVVDDSYEEDWCISKCDCEICKQMNEYNLKFNEFKPENDFEKLIYNSIVKMSDEFNL